MGIRALFLNGFNIEEKIVQVESDFKRANLTNPPDLVQYKTLKGEKIDFLVNPIHSYVSIQSFGDTYEKVEDAFECYNQDKDQLYTSLYNECIQKAKLQFQTQWEDTDWCILVIEDKTLTENMKFHEGYIIFNNCNPDENIYFRAFLDCCFIDQSLNRVNEFLKSLDISKQLTKFQQYQIAYYSEQLFKVKNPSMFLTNYKEINIYKVIYEEWNLSEKIDNTLAILNQSVSNYSFLWEYNNTKNQKISNTILTLFTVIVAYTSLKDVIVDFIPDYVKYFKIIFISIIVFFVCKMLYFSYQQWCDKNAYNSKTK